MVSVVLSAALEGNLNHGENQCRVIYTTSADLTVSYFSNSAFSIYTNTWFKRLLYLVVILHSGLTFIEPPSMPP